MRVTIAICTWNRAALLDQTLEALTRLEVPADLDWELLVVNNNSTDATDEVLAQYTGKLPLRPIHEARQGLSHARNRAVDEAKGELLLFTDDDVLVRPDWLSQYIHAAEAWPDCDFLGGPVTPWFGAPPPDWLRHCLSAIGPTFALLDHGNEVRPLTGGEAVYGANMAFRLDALRSYRFDARRGRVGTQLLDGEETALHAAMRQDGRRGLWVGTAPVQHYLPAERLTRQWIWDRHEAPGRAAALEADPTPTWFGVPRWLLRRYAETTVARWYLRARGKAGWAYEYTRQAHYHGMIAGYREQSRQLERRLAPQS